MFIVGVLVIYVFLYYSLFNISQTFSNGCALLFLKLCKLLQEHFLENAKLSANYFITDSEELLVCCLSLSVGFTLSFLFSSLQASGKFMLIGMPSVQRAAAVIDELPLGLQEKYLFCIRYSFNHESSNTSLNIILIHKNFVPEDYVIK